MPKQIEIDNKFVVQKKILIVRDILFHFNDLLLTEINYNYLKKHKKLYRVH